ncbi:MAG: ECF-type sigma factor [Phycisphaerales bacterium]
MNGALPAEAAVLYRELRRLAAGLLGQESPGHTLQPTALVHEAFLRMARDAGSGGAMNSLGAMGIAMRVMRQVLVDHARRKNAVKRGGGRAAFSLDEREVAEKVDSEDSVDILALNEALERFEKLDPRAAQVVQLRFFAGMTVPEVAGVLGICVSTAEDEWRVSKAWLARELREGRA